MLNSGYTTSFERRTYRVVTPKGAPIIPLRSVVDMETPQDWLHYLYPDRITDEFYLTFSLTLDTKVVKIPCEEEATKSYCT